MADKVKVQRVTLTIHEEMVPVDSNNPSHVALAERLSQPHVHDIKSYRIMEIPKPKTGVVEFTIKGFSYYKNEKPSCKKKMKASNENGPYVAIPVPTVRTPFDWLSDEFTQIEKSDIIVKDVVMTPCFWGILKKDKLFKDSCDLGSNESCHIGYVWGARVWLSEAVSREALVYRENDPNFLKDWPAFANWGMED